MYVPTYVNTFVTGAGKKSRDCKDNTHTPIRNGHCYTYLRIRLVRDPAEIWRRPVVQTTVIRHRQRATESVLDATFVYRYRARERERAKG